MCLSMRCFLCGHRKQWKKLGSDSVWRSVKVFCCQLPRANPFHSSEAPRHDGIEKPLGNGADFYNWFFTWKGDKFCSSCKRARYCSKNHQAMHWHSGHKVACVHMTNPDNGRTISTNCQKVASKTLWPKHEIINEDGFEVETEMLEIDKCANSTIPMNQVDETVKSLLHKFKEDDEKTWASFPALIAKALEQVLRCCLTIADT